MNLLLRDVTVEPSFGRLHCCMRGQVPWVVDEKNEDELWDIFGTGIANKDMPEELKEEPYRDKIKDLLH